MPSTLPTAHAGGTPVLSFAPVVLPVPDRPVDLQLRVSAPVTGSKLPIILLSHGHGPSNYVSSLYGYSPLSDYFAAHGFVVIQPTHLDSATLGLRNDSDPEAPLYWRSRPRDMSYSLDSLDDVETAVPLLAGRIDRDTVAVVGHSMGGHTASLLLGAEVTDPNDGRPVTAADPRIGVGVLLSAPGRGDALSQVARDHYPVLSGTDFSTMTRPALVIRGGSDDITHLTTAGPEWLDDPFLLAPGPKSLFVLRGAGHGLGGVAAYDLAETDDENPASVAAVRELSAAFLRTTLDPDEQAWPNALDRLRDAADPLGEIRSK